MRPTHVRAALAVFACLLAGCASGDNAAPAPLDTLTHVDSLPVTSSTLTPDTTPDTGVPATPPVGSIALSADGPWKLVDSAPGVTTPGLVYELMPGLWAYLPLVEDIPNGITWVLNKDDLPVIEAYLMARLVFFRATSQRPIDLADPGWTTWYADGGSAYAQVFESRISEHEIFDRGSGVVLRPMVLGEDRTDQTAIVFDCMLDGGVWRRPDGSLGEGSTPGVIPNGLGARFELVSGHWLTTKVANQPDACL